MNKKDLLKLIKEANDKLQDGKVKIPMREKGVFTDLLQGLLDLTEKTPEQLTSNLTVEERLMINEEYLAEVDFLTEKYLESIMNSLIVTRIYFNTALDKAKFKRDKALKNTLKKLKKDGKVVNFPTNYKESKDEE